MDPRAVYEAGRVEAQARVSAQESRIQALSAARLVVAGLIAALVVGFVWWHLDAWAFGPLGVLLLAFGALVVVHARGFAAKAKAEASLRFYERGLARLDGSWRRFPGSGARYAASEHPFSEDLDIFGPSSLFQLLDASETPFGADALAALLAAESPTAGRSPSGVPWEEELRSRQAAVRELAPQVEFRGRLSVEGAVLRTDAPDPEPFLRWVEGGAAALPVPAAVTVAARLLPLVVLAAALGAQALGLPRHTWLAVVILEVALSARYRDATSATVSAVSEHAGSFARYGALFGRALELPCSSPRLTAALGPLAASGGHAGVVREMAALERLVGFVEARRNEVFRLFLGTVLMWDLNFAVLLDAWRRRTGAHVRGWFEAIGELEALASLAGFAFDRPDHVWPELRPDAQLVAAELGHPLIDAGRRVGNDVSLPKQGTALVVTGSNMSGKSTLLRAIGVNVVLAQAGAPVAATAFALGQVRLATSMRIKDSLEEGVSHFYAELKKLKRVVDLAGEPPPLLFLLDEILHGTNSRERIIGARAVVLGLLARGAMGAVSTHDLGIADMASSAPRAVENVHFEEQVGDDGAMTFDYRLRAGTVQSSNALRLMRAIGLDVPLEALEAKA